MKLDLISLFRSNPNVMTEEKDNNPFLLHQGLTCEPVVTIVIVLLLFPTLFGKGVFLRPPYRGYLKPSHFIVIMFIYLVSSY